MKLLIRTFLVLGVILLTSCREDENFYTNVLRSDVFTQLYAVHDYDFLWVMDNSGSMAPRRQYVRDNMQSFINVLSSRKAVDYQMAATDTDFFTRTGDLITSGSGVKVVKSLAMANPVAAMAGIIDAVTDSGTSFWEQGLESAYQAVFKHKSEFSRSGVPLVLIVFSDEDDFSCADNCFGVEPEHNANWVPFQLSRYTNYFKNIKAAENSEVIVFPIVGQSNSTCSVASLGTRYESVASQVAGLSVSGSICLNDLPMSLDTIARTLADRGIRFPLTTQSSGQGIHVFVDGQSIPLSEDNGFVYEAATNSIVFTGSAVPANGSTIEVNYRQTN